MEINPCTIDRMKKARKAALFYSAPWYRAIHVANEIEYQIDDCRLSSIPEKMDGLLDQPKTIRENRSKTIEKAIAELEKRIAKPNPRWPWLHIIIDAWPFDIEEKAFESMLRLLTDGAKHKIWVCLVSHCADHKIPQEILSGMTIVDIDKEIYGNKY